MVSVEVRAEAPNPKASIGETLRRLKRAGWKRLFDTLNPKLSSSFTSFSRSAAASTSWLSELLGCPAFKAKVWARCRAQRTERVSRPQDLKFGIITHPPLFAAAFSVVGEGSVQTAKSTNNKPSSLS